MLLSRSDLSGIMGASPAHYHVAYVASARPYLLHMWHMWQNVANGKCGKCGTCGNVWHQRDLHCCTLSSCGHHKVHAMLQGTIAACVLMRRSFIAARAECLYVCVSPCTQLSKCAAALGSC